MDNDITPARKTPKPSQPEPARVEHQPPASPSTTSVPGAAPGSDTPPQSPLQGPTRKKPIYRRAWVVIIAALLLILAAAAAWLIWWYNDNLQPVNPTSEKQVVLSVPEGATLPEISALLHEKQLIKNQAVFEWYTKHSGTSNLLQAGAYRMKENSGVPSIVAQLTSGKTDSFNVTFLPGATVDAHKAVLRKAGYSSADIDAAFRKNYSGSLFQGKPDSADLEGYIYGETYNFPADATVEQILQRTFDEMERVITENNLVAKYKKRNLSLYEGITLASIVQREEKELSDQKKVAQVFFLRLKKDMPLGSDPTYQYIADKTGQARDPGLDSPYNTRNVTGLPPGPIASPGETALLAVASPAPGDYLYFLNGDDHQMYFARTLEEHEANIRNHCQQKCQIL